jgi:hypothetical protein
VTSPWVRVRQVWDLLTKRPTPDDEAWARDRLTEAEFALYQAMRPYDRYHCALIARRFAELNPPDWAIRGALLHDCGKPPGYGLWWRVLMVLCGDPAIAPDPLHRSPWQRAQQLYRWHGLYGSRLALAAGLPESGCCLIRDHHARPDPSDNGWLATFQRLDDD